MLALRRSTPRVNNKDWLRESEELEVLSARRISSRASAASARREGSIAGSRSS